MRRGKSLGACDFVERKCDHCGRTFVPAPYHAWKRDPGRTYWFCSYTCMIAWDRENPHKKHIKNYNK